MKIKLQQNSCIICGAKLYKYKLCEECHSLIDFDIKFYNKLDYVDEVVVCCVYDWFLREQLINFKFRECLYLDKMFTEMLSDKLLESKLHLNYDIITDVPMHKIALKKRGYNQSELLAKGVSENTLVPYKKLLSKEKNNIEQVGLNNEERLENVKSVFKVIECDYKNILIIDDVITTGATVNEIAKELKKNGANKVAALVVATRQLV